MSTRFGGADVKIALFAGLAITAIAVIATLLHRPAAVARTNSIARTTLLAQANEDAGACQGHETLPQGTSAIRLSLATGVGPRVTVAVRSGSRLITQGTERAGWVADANVPVRPVPHTYSNVRVCFHMTGLSGYVRVNGTKTAPGVAAISTGGEALPGRLRIEYLRPGRAWLALVPAVLRHMALGRAAGGIWIVIPIATLAAAAVAVASWAVLRELG